MEALLVKDMRASQPPIEAVKNGLDFPPNNEGYTLHCFDALEPNRF